MSKCKQCNVTILDDATVCPLCSCVVEAGEAHESIYPVVVEKERKLKIAANIIFFAVVFLSALVICFDFTLWTSQWWSPIPVASMAYAYLVFRLVIISQKGYRSKVLIPLLFGILLVLIIDAETGFGRWSLNFVLPSGILLVDLMILILMLTNLRDWESYIIMQVGMMVTSLVPVLLWIFHIITHPLVSFIALGVSVFLFLGTLIVGDHTARRELRRRFHIR